jgi:hypothetical protein
MINKDMKNYIKNFDFLIVESKGNDFTEFAQERHDGASDIVERAQKKGGTAMLTYHHFVVKLPYYKKAAAGKFNQVEAKAELKVLTRELTQLLKTFEPKDQIPFQKIMGKIEAVGELLLEKIKTVRRINS